MKKFFIVIVVFFIANIGFSQYVISVFDKSTNTELDNYDVYFVNEKDSIQAEFVNDSTFYVSYIPDNFKLVVRYDTVVCEVLHPGMFDNFVIGLDPFAKSTCVFGYQINFGGNKFSYSQDLNNGIGFCGENFHFVGLKNNEEDIDFQYHRCFVDKAGSSCFGIFESINDTIQIQNRDKFETITIIVSCVFQGKVVQLEIYDSKTHFGYESLMRYSNSNKLTERKIQLFGGSLYGRFKYFYDEKDNLQKIDIYDKSDEYIGSNKYLYDENNLKIRNRLLSTYAKENSMTGYCYYPNDSLKFKLEFKSFLNFYKTEYIYGDDNKLIQKNVFHNNQLKETVVINYSESGCKSEELTYNNDTLLKKSTFDKDGNEIEILTFNMDGTEKEYRYIYIIKN